MSWTDVPPAAGGGRLVRRSLSVLLAVACALMVPLAVTAHWAVRVVDDPAQYQRVLAPLAASPQVQRAVIDRVTAELVGWAEHSGAQVPAGAFRSQVRSQVAVLVRAPSFGAQWDRAVARSHPVVRQTLRGQRGEVAPAAIDLTTLVGPVAAGLRQQGITALDGLADRTGPGGGHRVTIRVIASGDVTAAQGAFAAVEVLQWALALVAAVAAAGALVTAVRRLRTLVGLVLGIALASGALAAVVAAAGVPVGRPTSSAGDAVTAAFLRDLRGELLVTFVASAAVGVVLLGANALVESRERRRQYRRLS